jgi:multidrug efflux system outer membrane protein
VVASQLSYRDWYGDPKLQALIANALANNRDLLAATARIEQARAQFRIDESRRLPDLVATGSGNRTRQATAGNPVFGAGDGNAPTSFTFNRFDIGVGISAFELDFWGRVRNQSEAARARYLAEVANQRAFYLSLVADTATTYFEIVETEEQIVLAEATARSRREGLRIAKLRPC